MNKSELRKSIIYLYDQIKLLYLYKEVSQNVEEANAWDIFGNRIQGLAQKVLNTNSWN